MEPTLKNKIMNSCPNEFREDLESFLHVLITKILGIKYKMDITSISKLSDIEEAYKDLDRLADELYFDRHTTQS